MRQIKSGILLSYLSLLVSNIANIVLTPIMLNKLGANQYGVINLAMAIINYFLIFDIGMGNTSIKFFTKLRVKNKKDELNRMTTIFYLINGVIAIFILIIGMIIIKNIDLIGSGSIDANNIKDLKLILGCLFIGNAIMLPLSTFEYLLFAYEKYIIFKLLNMIRIGIIPLILVIALFFTDSAITIIIINMVLSILVRIFTFIYCIKKRIYSFSIGSIRNELKYMLIKEILIHAGFVLIGMIADKIIRNSDQIIIGSKFGSEDLVMYTLAINLSRMYININGIPGEFNTSYLTKLIADNNKEKLSSAFVKISKLQFILSTYIYFGFVAIGKDFIQVWVGDGYTKSYYIALIIITGTYICISDNVGSKIVKLKGKHRLYSYVKLILAIINIPVTIVLIDKIGIIGGAISTLVIYIIPMNIIMNIYYLKKINLDILKLISESKKIFLVGIMSLILLKSNIIKFSIYGIGKILLLGVVFTIVYLILLYLIGIDDIEKSYVKKYLSIRSRVGRDSENYS